MQLDPLIAEARRRAQRRRLALTLLLLAAVAGGLTAWRARPVAPTAPTLELHVRGFGTALPAQTGSGSCPDGRTRLRLSIGSASGSIEECVLFAGKTSYPSGAVRSVVERVRDRYRLPGGTIVTRESHTIRFARDQVHTTAVFSGRVVGGSGRYAGARGTVSGGGPGTGEVGDWTLRMRLGS